VELDLLLGRNPDLPPRPPGPRSEGDDSFGGEPGGRAVRVGVSSFPGDGVSGGVANFVVDDVDALHAELVSRGIAIALAPTDQTWGNREMYVRDADGNTLRFLGPGGGTR
jgi:catechol 2,3-dioxygenase-like lactoylglutathione lyase family enzyme